MAANVAFSQFLFSMALPSEARTKNIHARITFPTSIGNVQRFSWRISKVGVAGCSRAGLLEPQSRQE
uniref:Putative secreted protein n=1 Tax=Ixodes ricinus TaxID=34613 RepID=A0A6B0TQM0_IXORI